MQKNTSQKYMIQKKSRRSYRKQHISFNIVINIQHDMNFIYNWETVRVMVFNATFNNISVISWWSVLLVEETGVLRENHRPAASH